MIAVPGEDVLEARPVWGRHPAVHVSLSRQHGASGRLESCGRVQGDRGTQGGTNPGRSPSVPDVEERLLDEDGKVRQGIVYLTSILGAIA